MKPITTQERWGPIVLLEETRQRWVGQQCEVVAVGAEEICEDEDCARCHHLSLRTPPLHPCLVKAGDWLLCRPRCFVATDVEDVWVCKQSDVLARLTLAPAV